jgi:hypothetical protein
MYADQRRMEAAVMSSDLDWTVVRPSGLFASPAVSAYAAHHRTLHIEDRSGGLHAASSPSCGRRGSGTSADPAAFRRQRPPPVCASAVPPMRVAAQIIHSGAAQAGAPTTRLASRSAATRAAVTGQSTTLCDQRQARMCRRVGTTSIRDQVPGAEGWDLRSSQPNLTGVSREAFGGVPAYLIAAEGDRLRFQADPARIRRPAGTAGSLAV